MGKQEQVSKQTSAPSKHDETLHADPSKAEAADTTDIDDLLDEIDGILEENAQEFVANYIQKGGQ